MKVFADTNFYVAMLNSRDQYHARAMAYTSNTTDRIVTSDFVLLEVANFHTKPADRPVFVSFLTLLRHHPRTTIVSANTNWMQRGIDLFAKRLDKEWSLTDCITFEMMSDLGLTHGLTADHHIIQAGFTIEFP